jgi:phospholipase/carboxylesterase
MTNHAERTPEDALLDAITALMPPLLGALDALRHAGRYLHPPTLADLAAAIAPAEAPLAAALHAFEAQDWPAGLADFRAAVAAAAGHALKGIRDFAAAPQSRQRLMAAYRASGQGWRAQEALYPVAAMLPPVSRYFVDPAMRDDPACLSRLAGSDFSRADAGVLHLSNETGERGGFSLYVPEYPAARPRSLVVALHGGSGHGRGFLWSWLRECRARDCLLVAPTSRTDTWSLMGPDHDTPNLLAIIDWLSERWPVDRNRVLLTGMSDGGTFTWVSGLGSDRPFTHLAPVAGTFHPFLLEQADPARLRGMPVYLVHGALDWMFPVDVAQMAAQVVGAAGARVTYREIADLSHTWPVEETARILDWFLQPA